MICVHFQADAPDIPIGTCAAKRFPHGKTGLAYCESGLCRLRVEGPEGEPIAANPARWRPRPGSALKWLLSKVGIPPAGCGCNSHAAQMDQLGAWWVARNAGSVATWLVAEGAKRKLPLPALHRPGALLLVWLALALSLVRR